MVGGVSPAKHVEQLRNIGIINSTTRPHLVGSFFEIYITMHRSMNIKVVDVNYISLSGEVQFLSMMSHFWKMGQCNSNLGV